MAGAARQAGVVVGMAWGRQPAAVPVSRAPRWWFGRELMELVLIPVGVARATPTRAVTGRSTLEWMRSGGWWLPEPLCS